MSRYFFHVENHPSRPDPEGTELPDVHAARCQALRYAGELLIEADPSHFMHHEPVRLRVKDESGRDVVVLEIHDKIGRGSAAS
jgi:hypothetical protein